MARTSRASVFRDRAWPSASLSVWSSIATMTTPGGAGTRARQKKPPVEGQIFDPVQTGGDAHHLFEAEPSAEHKSGGDEAAGQQP